MNICDDSGPQVMETVGLVSPVVGRAHEIEGAWAANPATGQFDQDRWRFIGRYLAFLNDPTTPVELKSHELAGTISALRQLAHIAGVTNA